MRQKQRQIQTDIGANTDTNTYIDTWKHRRLNLETGTDTHTDRYRYKDGRKHIKTHAKTGITQTQTFEHTDIY